MNSSDYQLALNGQLAADLSHRTKWMVTGVDRTRYLNGQTTCDLKSLNIGHCTWAAVTNVKGKLDGTLHVAAALDALLVDTEPSLAESLLARLTKYIISDDVEISDVSAEWKLYHFLGALSPAKSLTSAVPHFTFQSNRFGLLGYDLWLPAKHEAAIISAPTHVWNTIRIENTVPAWGIDMDLQNLAPEMPFERLGALSYRKGCYIGQEVIARIKSIGRVNKQLCLLHSESMEEIALPSPCLCAGKEVGKATSWTVSSSGSGSYLLATLSRASNHSGQELEISGQHYRVT